MIGWKPTTLTDLREWAITDYYQKWSINVAVTLPTFDQGVTYLLGGMNGAPAWVRNGANDLLWWEIKPTELHLWFNPRVSRASPAEVINLRELAARVLQVTAQPSLRGA